MLCARCTRFCDQISGDRFIELFARGAGERVSIAAGEDFRSPFSGNTVQICPVGALTADAVPVRGAPVRPHRRSTRSAPTAAPAATCKVDVRRGEVVRQLARDNLDVNDAWLCDKGRFAFRFPDAPDRITTPLIRDRGLEPASFGEVLTRIAEWTEGARVAFLTGGRLMDEDYYALSKLARTVFRTNDLDHRRGRRRRAGRGARAWRPNPMVGHVQGRRARDGDPRRGPRRRAGGADPAPAPAQGRGARGEDLGRCTRAARGCTTWRRTCLCAPGDEARLLAGGADHVIGRSARRAPRRRRPGDRDRRRAAGGGRRGARGRGGRRRAVRVRHAPRERSRRAPRRRASRAAARAAAAIATSAARSRPCGVRSSTASPGVTRTAILQACADREIDVLFLIGVDPLRDAPDAALARRALQNVPIKVVQSLELGDPGAVRGARSCRRRPSSRRRATSRPGKGAASGSGAVRGAARASACPTGRSSRAWRSRAAAIWGSRRSTSCTRRWAGCWRRATAETAARPGAAATARRPRRLGPPPLHLPAARRRGPALRARRRAEGGARGAGVRRDPSRGRRGGRDRRRRSSGRAHRRRRGERRRRASPSTSRRVPSSCRSTSRVWRRTRCCRAIA